MSKKRLIRNVLRYSLLFVGLVATIHFGNIIFAEVEHPTPPQIPIAIGMMLALYIMGVWWITGENLEDKMKDFFDFLTR
jgi:hypothetical protein